LPRRAQDAAPSSPRQEDSAGSITLTDVRNTYRRYARVYDRLFGAVLEDSRRKVLREVRLLQPRRILELGVGTGLMLDGYPRDSAVTGIDVSDEMLAIARWRVKRLELRNVQLELADGERLPYADASFDCIVLPYVLSVTPTPEKLVQEAIRLCAPGGRIIIVNHFSGSRFWNVFERVAAPLAAKIGFHSTFSYSEHVLSHPWQVEKVISANLLGLSRVVVLTPPTQLT